MFALAGAWTNSGGTWTYSPYLPGNDDPNKPPPGAGTAVPGPPYYSTLCPGVALDTWILPDGQKTVDWSKCGTASPYPTQPPTQQQPPPSGSTPPGGEIRCAIIGKKPLAGEACCLPLKLDAQGICNAVENTPPPAGDDFFGFPKEYLIYGAIAVVALMMLKR